MTALAVLNFSLALVAFAVFFYLTRKRKTAIRFLYGLACFGMIYVAAFYGHMFITGYSLGVEFSRPATGMMLSLLLAVGIYELFRS